MNLYVMGEMVFAELRRNQSSKIMLCIGSKAEVDGANEEQITKLIREALAISEYHHIEHVQGLVLH